MSSEWYYIEQRWDKDHVMGPLSDQGFFDAFWHNEVKQTTQVSHPKHTAGVWLEFGKTKVFQQFNAHKAQREANEKAIREQQEQQQKAEAAEKRRQQKVEADLEFEERRRIKDIEDAEQQQQETERLAEIAARKESQKKIQSQAKQIEGSDRWPKLLEYSNYIDGYAFFMRVILVSIGLLPVVFIIATALLSASEVHIASYFEGFLALIVLILTLAMCIVYGLIVWLLAYIMTLGIHALADFLRCMAAIEANTRRLWNENSKENG